MLNAPKLAVLGAWGWSLAAIADPKRVPLSHLAPPVIKLMIGAHSLEALIFMKDLKRTGKPLTSEVINTLLFGFVHLHEVRKALPAKG